jgi:hypothetical protein
MKLRTFRFAAALAATIASAAAAAQTLPPGWQARPAADGRMFFVPANLAAGEDTAVSYSQRTPLGDRALDRWLADAVAADAPPSGAWLGTPQVKGESANIAQATRQYRDASGHTGFAFYVAVSIDQSNARLARWTANSEATARRYADAGKSLVSQLAEVERHGASADHRAARVESAMPGVKGIRAGGELVPGKYEGDLMSDKTFLFHISILLHANGEYEFLKGSTNVDNFGKVRYQPATGKLDVAFGALSNNPYRPDEQFCLFGRDANGAPVIYAEEDRGTSTSRAWLRRVGDVDRPPHSEAVLAKAAAAAEAARYKFVASPGQGVQASQIEAVFYEWKQVYAVGGLQMHETVYLLLKDGSVRDGIPVAPTELDAQASQRGEPKAWGRWRREGADYAFAWGGSREFRKAQGFALAPGARGIRMEGEWTTSSSFAFVGGASAWSTASLRLRRDGRFEKLKSGGAAAGGPGTSSETMASTVYDDKGSVSSGSSPNFAAGNERKFADRGDRSGSYEIDGYNITLHFDDGTVVRQPFAQNPRNRALWFGGSLMTAR